MATDPLPEVEITGGRGIVGVNYGTVFQSFAAAPAPLQMAIRSDQFRSVVDERARGFVGREFVFEQIDRALAEPAGSGYLFITGEPGIGKTTVAAALVLRHGYPHHFNIAADNIRTARQFLENICAQLIVRYGLDHSGLPQSAGEDSGFLGQLLRESADVAAARGQLPVVIVVDALDEADRTESDNGANRLFLPRTLPAGVYFIVTGREEDDTRLQVDHLREIRIDEGDQRNQQDVESYIRRFVADHHDDAAGWLQEWGTDVEEFVATVAERSEGNFMYLVYVLADIAERRWAGTTVPVRYMRASFLPAGVR